jgi:N-acetylglucosamine kinase-like BadF-type ATPase
MASDYVLALDAGGTWLRVAAAELVPHADSVVVAERRVLCGRADQDADVVAVVAETLDDVLTELGRVRVAAGVGCNGLRVADGWTASRAGAAPFMAMSEATLALHPDDPSGTVLIAGTGAAAATVIDGVEIYVDGALHGVPGCGQWIGEQALGGTAESCGLLPREVAAIATGIIRAAGDGDAKAQAIVDRAGEALLAMVDTHLTRLDSPVTEITLVGSLTDPAHALGTLIGDGLGSRGMTTVHVPDLVVPAVRWAAAVAERFTARRAQPPT